MITACGIIDIIREKIPVIPMNNKIMEARKYAATTSGRGWSTSPVTKRAVTVDAHDPIIGIR